MASVPPKIYSIVLTEAAKRGLKSLANIDPKLFAQVNAKILALAKEPRPVGCTKLTNRADYRVRVRHWRILYQIQDKVLLVNVMSVLKRAEGTYDS